MADAKKTTQEINFEQARKDALKNHEAGMKGRNPEGKPKTVKAEGNSANKTKGK